MTAIHFDIETIGTTDPGVIADIAANIKPPGNISKAETIAKWEAENKQKAVDEAVAKTSFDGGLGSIICIALAVDDKPVQSKSGDERESIQWFFDILHDEGQRHYQFNPGKPPAIVGHNIIGFDLRFLWQRAVCLGIKPPGIFPTEYWQMKEIVKDTMVMWNPDRDKRISLGRLCHVLGVPSSKDNMDGSQVWGFFKAGRIDEIDMYCRADVEATRQCYQKMTFAGIKEKP
jgi:3'-5' exonuclease